MTTLVSWAVRAAVPADQSWLLRCWDKRLGSFGQAWYRFWHGQPGVQEHWLVIPEAAFCHYRVRRDGSRTIYEIAVAPEKRRRGLARALVERVGRPVQLKTDAANDESNQFYRALGFQLVGRRAAKSGKAMNLYFAPG